MTTLWKAFLVVVVSIGAIHAQLSASAYRVLGQTDLRQNGVNLVQGVELYQPSGIALDARGGQTHLYIADTHNSRVMAWFWDSRGRSIRARWGSAPRASTRRWAWR